MTNEILTTALRFANQGIVVVPVRGDGSKAPALASWKQFQDRQPTQDELLTWFNNETVQGLGLICGAASGGLEMLEFEARAIAQGMHKEAMDAVIKSGMKELWQRLVDGYMETTPSGGLHFLYRIADAPVPGNEKIAQMAGEDGGCLIETRGEGGFTITAPSGGTAHPSGKAWTMASGSIETIPTITFKERNDLFTILATFDEMPKPEITKQELVKREFDPSLPGDDYNQRGPSWPEILEPLGWSRVFSQGEKTLWCRPGKDHGISASTNHGGYDTFFVFSTSTSFEANKGYSKFAVYAHVNHRDDFTEAAQALRFQGYGGPVNVFQLNDYEYSPTTGEIVDVAPPDGDGGGVDYVLQNEIRLARARREAKRQLDLEEASANIKMPEYFGHLGQELELPIEELQWAIKDLFPTGANVTLTAQYKAGKTTLINSLTRSLADGEKFLNYFEAPVHPGRITIFNYEVNTTQYRRWFKDVNVKNVEKVSMYHMKGSMAPILAPYVQDYLVEFLKGLETQTWILDPFAGAFTGSGDENSNSDVTVFLNILDNIKLRAGIQNLVMPIHTGRAQEHGVDRARGATRLDDWADVRWILKKTQDGRFFSADGRDVLQEEQALAYDPISRSLSFGGADAYMTKRYNNEDLWLNAVLANQGKTTSEISALLNKRPDDKGMLAARKSLQANKKLKIVRVGASDCWFDINYISAWEQGEVG